MRRNKVQTRLSFLFLFSIILLSGFSLEAYGLKSDNYSNGNLSRIGKGLGQSFFVILQYLSQFYRD